MSDEEIEPDFKVTVRVQVDLDMVIAIPGGPSETFESAALLAPGRGRQLIVSGIELACQANTSGNRYKIVNGPFARVTRVLGEWAEDGPTNDD